MSELKPCPYCEPPAMITPSINKASDGTDYVNCFDCGSCAPLEVWNSAYCWKLLDEQRLLLDAQKEVIKKLKEAIILEEKLDNFECVHIRARNDTKKCECHEVFTLLEKKWIEVKREALQSAEETLK